MKSNILKIFLPIICGLTVANMYYIQSVFIQVMQSMSISYQMASMVYTMSLIGNLSSLFLITPLGDFINRKKLISTLYLLLTVTCVASFLSKIIYITYISAYFLGVGVAIIPITISYLSTKEGFGVNYIGKIMSGVLLGALISRFLSSEFSTIWGWNSIYLFSAIMMVISLALILVLLPNDDKGKDKDSMTYVRLIYSTFSLIFVDRNIRKHCLYGFLVMAIFSAFWNNISITLYDNYNFSQTYIGFFSLTGIAGASAAMLANNILKKINYKNNILFLLMFLSFSILIFVDHNIFVLGIGAILIDAMIQLIHVNNQISMYKNSKGIESRAASCYMIMFILGGVIGSNLSSNLYGINGWQAVCIMCSLITAIGLLLSSFKIKSEGLTLNG